MNKLILLAGALACIASPALAVDLWPAQAAAAGLQQPETSQTLGKKLGLRLHYHGGNAADSIELRGRPRFDSFSLLGDWHPRATGLRLTAGVVANRAGFDPAAAAAGTAPGAAHQRYVSPALQAASGTRHVDPYLGLGWSKLPSRGKGLGFYADAGVLFQHPRAGLTPASLSAADAAAEHHDTHRSVDSRHRYNPVLSIGVTYGF